MTTRDRTRVADAASRDASAARPGDAAERDATRTVRVRENGVVAYAEYGARDGTPVVLFHGTPGSHVLGELYDVAASRRGVRLLAVDRPGYGESTPLPDRTPADAAEYVDPVLDDAGVSEVGVVGFSGGSLDALGFAATRPAAVSGVDLVSGAVPPPVDAPTPGIQRLLGGMATRAPRLLGGLLAGQAWVARRGRPSVVVDQYTSDAGEIPDETAEIVARDFVTAVGDRRDGMVTESRWSTDEWDVPLDEVDPRVRLWHGDRDENVPVEGARRLADRLPNATIDVVEGADHLEALLSSRTRILDRCGSENGGE